jgi:hypothetical protein
MAEQEGEHRRAVEQRIVQAQVDDGQRDSSEAKRGQLCALAITLAAIGAGAYTALQGHEIAGSIIGVGGIGSIVTTFLLGNRAKDDNGEPAPNPPKTGSTKKTKNRK